MLDKPVSLEGAERELAMIKKQLACIGLQEEAEEDLNRQLEIHRQKAILLEKREKLLATIFTLKRQQ